MSFYPLEPARVPERPTTTRMPESMLREADPMQPEPDRSFPPDPVRSRPRERRDQVPAFAALLLLGLPLWAGCGTEGNEQHAESGDTRADVAVERTSGADSEISIVAVEGPSTRAATYAGSVLDLPPLTPEEQAAAQDAHETERDWAIARGTVEWARGQGLAPLPTGELAALIAATFVGTPYEPGTLELPGEERLVVNLRTFDCVTLVEHALVLARMVALSEEEWAGERTGLERDEAFRERFRQELAGLRYRNGVAEGYLSRLHYFSEWLDRGIDAGEFTEVTGDLGGVVDDRPIHFMSSNPHAYRQLDEDPGLVEEIRRIEARLSQRDRLYIPQDRIREVETGIQNGDIIAAVSGVDGLDIAHTGLALWHDDRLHLLHAPLVGDSVEVSPRPLADRIQRNSGQVGIRVVRPH